MAIKSNQSVVLMDASGRSVEYARLQMRRGLESQFDASKMLPAEFAVTTDTKKAYLAFAAGDVKRLSTYEDMTQDLADALAEIEQEYLGQISTATSKAQAATSAANKATQSANTATANANAAVDEARKTIWNNKNLTNSTSASESQVETAAGAAVLTGVDGKTEQVTTTGAQLFDASKIKTIEIPGTIKIKNNGDGSFELDGTYTNYYGQNYAASLDKGTYFVSTKESVEEKTMFFVRVVKEGIGTKDYYVGQMFQIDGTETKIKIYVQCNPNKTYNNVIITPMLNAGSEPLPWEPYTGGIPGPNPDYPIPVQGVGGKTGDESFGFNAAVQSYQLFDASKLPTKSEGGGTVTNNGDGTFTVSGSGTFTSTFILDYRFTHEETVKMIKSGKIELISDIGKYPYYGMTGGINGKAQGTFEINSVNSDVSSFDITDELLNDDSFIIRIFIYCYTGYNIDQRIIKPMIYQDGDGTFQKYHRSELPIALTQPLFEGDKIMMVKAGQTYVDADGATQTADRDLWGIYRNTVMYKFDGDEQWQDNVTDQTGEKRFLIDLANKVKISDKTNGVHSFNTSFQLGGNGSTWSTYNRYTINENPSGGKSALYVRKDADTTLETFKQYLAEKPMYLVAELETPYFDPFADQAPFFAWTTPTGGCTITTDDPLEPIISADTAQTPEGSYLLTGYVEGLRARTLEQRILELEKKAIQEV